MIRAVMHEIADARPEPALSEEPTECETLSDGDAVGVIEPAKACPVCDETDVSPLLSIRDVPVFCNVLWPTAEQALAAEMGNIELAFCRSCGHVYNSAFDAAKTIYSAAYENSLHFSQHFSNYAKALAQYLVETYGIHGKSVIDVGCGRGDFLSVLCATGNNRGYGFDKSYAPTESGGSDTERLTFVRDFYGPKYASYPCDLLSCRHVLEHIERPNSLLADIRRSSTENPDVVMYFEVPNAAYTLRDLGVWDLIYEHCSYYSVSSLHHLFVRNGFAVLRIAESYEGQFIGLECRPDTGVTVGPGGPPVAADAESFPERYREKLEYWRALTDELVQLGKRAVVWGAGSKGVTFLNLLRPSMVVGVVDLNPRKCGRYVPGTPHEVVAPDQLLSLKPDVIIIMNSVYADEIRRDLDTMGLAPELLMG